MKKWAAILSSTLVLAGSISCSWSQEIFPSQKELSVTITARVEQTPSGQFDYLYTIANDKNSKQTIDRIFFENKAPEGKFSIPKTWDNGHYTYESTYMTWAPAVFNEGEGSTLQDPPLDSVDPGEVSEEFAMLGHSGPPTIIGWKVDGWAPVPILDESRDVIISGGKEYPIEEWSDTILNHSETLPNADPADNRVNGKTIGPSTPPADPALLCNTFIIDLIGQVREATTLGWIKHDLRKDDDERVRRKGDDKGVKKGQDDDGDDHADDDVEMDEKDKGTPGAAKSMIKKLTKVRRECLRGKFGTAREKLRALIRQVNAQRGKHLTDEAYFLIKFNAEFLLEKI